MENLFNSNLEKISKIDLRISDEESPSYESGNMSVSFRADGIYVISTAGGHVELAGNNALALAKMILETYDPTAGFKNLIQECADYIEEQWNKLPSFLKTIPLATDCYDALFDHFADHKSKELLDEYYHSYNGPRSIELDELLNDELEKRGIPTDLRSNSGRSNLYTIIPWCTSTIPLESSHAHCRHSRNTGYSKLISELPELPEKIEGDDGSVALFLRLLHTCATNSSNCDCTIMVDDPVFDDLVNVALILDRRISSTLITLISYDSLRIMSELNPDYGRGYYHTFSADDDYNSNRSLELDRIDGGGEMPEIACALIYSALLNLLKVCPRMVIDNYRGIEINGDGFVDHERQY